MIRLRKARLSAGIVVGVATLVTPLAAVSVTATNAAAAPAAATATYHAKAGSATLRVHAGDVSGLTPRIASFSPKGPRALTHLAHKALSNVGAGDAAGAGVSTLGGPTGMAHTFNGLSDADQAKVNGGVGVGDVTPPDQGLCIGNDALLPGDPKVVFEAINTAIRETTTSGTPLRPDFSLATLFDDPFAQGDVRCLYDASAHTFFFTEIGYPAGGPQPQVPLPLNTQNEVAVWNTHGIADYGFDSSLGDTCFGDQPKTGFDNNALLMATDEFCGTGGVNYEGALAMVISKPELVAEDQTVTDALLGPVSLGGIPVTGLDPAINTGTGTGYFVNSFPFLADGNNNPVGNTLGLWNITNTADVVSDPAAITLTGNVINSESYAFPVPATSTGTGAVAAVDPTGDTGARDAAAWFAINVRSGAVAQQGYITARGANLLYPAVAAPQFGVPVAVFTITSKTINPSAAYTVLGSHRIITVANGAGAHVSFSDVLFAQARWGDYSFAQVDPSGAGIWLATEYIPPAANQDPIDNWGTYVFEVNQFPFGQ